MKVIGQKKSNSSDRDFQVRAATALGLSVVVDTLDYIGAPVFALPILGDVVDVIMMAILYRLTGSKTSAAVNSIELIPFIGDMAPTYTISTLLWILRESLKRKDKDSLSLNRSLHKIPMERMNGHINRHRNIVDLDSKTT